MKDEIKDFVIKIPVSNLTKILEDSGIGAIKDLSKQWSIVVVDDGFFTTEGFDDQCSCSDRVAKLHGTNAEVVYVLKNGIPRKNVRIEVKARFR
jgi:hypothetical protein